MVEFYLLEAFVTFAKYGTLAKAANQLGVTQPALTHSMKNLEAALDIQLFDRQPNKLSLTETGKYAVKEAQHLLAANRDFTSKVHQFDQSQAVITVAANAPGPLIVVRALDANNPTIQDSHVQHDFTQLLTEEQLTCLLTNHPLANDTITSVYLGTERMAVNLPTDSPLAQREQVAFADLAGNTFLCPQAIGFWRDIYEANIPNGHFIYQDQSTEYSELLSYSRLPFFTTNVTKLDPNWGGSLPQDRILKPLSDPIAHQAFYVSFLKRNQDRLTPFIQQTQDKWATVDF